MTRSTRESGCRARAATLCHVGRSQRFGERPYYSMSFYSGNGLHGYSGSTAVHTYHFDSHTQENRWFSVSKAMKQGRGALEIISLPSWKSESMGVQS